ncbi:MAG TPA: hypothetical protein VF282_00455 [Bacillota bacterium]
MAGRTWHWRVALLTVALVMAVSTPAAAHVPVFLWKGAAPALRPFFIHDIVERSFAFFGLVGQGELHRYRFVADAGDQIPLSLLVPAGQAAVTGAYVLTPGGGEIPLEPVHEPAFDALTQVRLVRVGRLHLTAPETGLYEVHVYPAEALAATGALAAAGGGARVKYLLAAGEPERFSPLDIFKVPLWWLEAHLWLWR